MKLLQLEQQLRFQSFQHSDALQLGLQAIQKVEQNQLKPIRIRIRYKGNIVFQYLMDGKTGDEWLNRKEQTVLETGHSSMFIYEHQDEYNYLLNQEQYAICGGGFPLIVDNEIKGVFCISGLKHDEDHQLIVNILSEYLLEKRKGE